MKKQLIDVSLIDIPEDRVRSITETGLTNIRQSVSEIGIEIAIKVRQNGGRYTLIYGAHRTTVAIEQGIVRVPAEVEPEDDSDLAKHRDRLSEIDENLARGDLTQGERARHSDERRRVKAKIKVLEAAEQQVVDEASRKRKSRAKKKVDATDTNSVGNVRSKTATTEFINEVVSVSGKSRGSVKKELSTGDTIHWVARLTETDPRMWCGPESSFDSTDCYESLRSLKASWKAWNKAAEQDTDWGKHAARMVERTEGELKRTAAYHLKNPDEQRKGTMKGMAEEYAYISQADYENREATARMERLKNRCKKASTIGGALTKLREDVAEDGGKSMSKHMDALDKMVEQLLEIQAIFEGQVDNQEGGV